MNHQSIGQVGHVNIPILPTWPVAYNALATFSAPSPVHGCGGQAYSQAGHSVLPVSDGYGRPQEPVGDISVPSNASCALRGHRPQAHE